MNLVPQNINEAIKHLKPRPKEELSKNEDNTIENWIESGNIVESLRDYIIDIYESTLGEDAAPNKDQIMAQFMEEDDFANKTEMMEMLLHEFDKEQLTKALKSFINGFREYANAEPIDDTYNT